MNLRYVEAFSLINSKIVPAHDVNFSLQDNRLDASEFIFQTWADQATKQNKPVNSLQFIGQKMVANEDTIQDIEGAFEANIVPPGIATMKLNYNEDEGSPRQYYFNRLSDGPNGSPINYMLKVRVPTESQTPETYFPTNRPQRLPESG